jgi:prepilin-type N-terminal cleavage/methylation domain-containing protein
MPMTLTPSNLRQHTAFTLVEMSVVIAIVTILAGVGLLSFRNQGETQDATLANSVQASLQIALGQMVVRLERPPAQVFGTANLRQRLMRFAQGSMGPTATLSDTGSGILLRFANSPRTVTYGLNNQGDVVITAETFARFTVNLAGQLAE